MKRALFVLSLLLALAMPGMEAAPSWRIDWLDYQPRAPLEVNTYYGTLYNSVVYVAARTHLHDGTQVLVIENVYGKWCNPGPVCAIPASTPRSSYLFPAYPR